MRGEVECTVVQRNCRKCNCPVTLECTVVPQMCGTDNCGVGMWDRLLSCESIGCRNIP